MKVDTHSLLLDAVLFGSPAFPRRGSRTGAATMPSDLSAATWKEPTTTVDGPEASPPICPTEPMA